MNIRLQVCYVFPTVVLMGLCRKIIKLCGEKYLWLYF